MQWWGDAVYTSEIGFLLDLPYLITYNPAVARSHTDEIRLWFFRMRLTFNTVGLVSYVHGWLTTAYVWLVLSLVFYLIFVFS